MTDTSQELLAPENMKKKFLVLRCYLNDKQYIQVPVDGQRNVKTAKQQACVILLKFYPQIKIVALLGLGLDGKITKEHFRYTIHHAKPWYVTWKEKFSGREQQERFVKRTDARKLYSDLERQDVLVSSNAR